MRSVVTGGWTAAGRRASDDAGFSLLEVLIAISLVALTMASLGTFFISSMASSDAQAVHQTAAQLANDGVERVRARVGEDPLAKRDATSVNTQWQQGLSGAIAGVSGYLTDMTKVSDPSAGTGSGASAPLPTTPVKSTVAGVEFSQHFFLGRCWQSNSGGVCDTTTRPVAMLRAVVAVTWRGKCPTNTCSYVTATLVNDNTEDPDFTGRHGAAPTITNPGTLSHNRGSSVSYQLNGVGSPTPLVWSATGLPTGLSISSSTGRVRGVPSSTGSRTVTVTLTDAYSRASSVTFTWTIR